MTICDSARSGFEPAADSPCAACPWRMANHGKRHPDGWYTKANLRRLWAGLRRGARMTCHPTDPDNPVPEGVARPSGAKPTRECTGSLILVQREIERVQDVFRAGGSFADYRTAHPLGLTRDGAAEVVGNSLFGSIGGLEMAQPNLNEPGIGCPGLAEWEPR